MMRNAPPGASKILSIGECMVEMARGSDSRFTLAVGGDTFNTAVYMARLGADVGYVTALGDDPYSDEIAATADSEGVDTAAITRVAGRMPGLYLIETDGGERSFWYWRDHAPARDLFELPDAETTIARLERADWIYFSGITLSLYSPAALDVFAAALTAAKAAGATVVMDSNYRPRGWRGDTERARATFQRFWSLADIALPTFDDEQDLWGEDRPAATIARLSGLGVGEICIKHGSDGATIWAEDTGTVAVACPEQLSPLDTTAAGDSFNAAYVCARIAGAAPDAAAVAGHRLAAIVISHRGALAPNDATDGYELIPSLAD